MPELVLDTVALRVMSFAHPDGIDMLLGALDTRSARFPAEVYNSDESSIPLGEIDEGLSELARGLRNAQLQVRTAPGAELEHYRLWLENAKQLPRHIRRGSLFIDPLSTLELIDREMMMSQFGIGRGEAAGLVLTCRLQADAVLLTSDAHAGRTARTLGIHCLTLRDVLERWVDRFDPTTASFDALVEGMRNARFGLDQEFLSTLRCRLWR